MDPIRPASRRAAGRYGPMPERKPQTKARIMLRNFLTIRQGGKRNKTLRALGAEAGASVFNLQDQVVGNLEEIIVDESSGTIAYAVLSFGAFMRMGDSLFAIPWEAFVFDREKRKLILNVKAETLEDAPGFQKSNWPDMGNPEWGEVIYNYYGYRPFWE